MTRSLTTNGMCWWWPSSSVSLLSWGSSSYTPFVEQDVFALPDHFLQHFICSASSGPTNPRVASWTTGQWGRLTFSWGSARRLELNPSPRFGHCFVTRILSDTNFLEGSCWPREAFGSLAHWRGVEGSRGGDQHLSDGRRQPEERL